MAMIRSDRLDEGEAPPCHEASQRLIRLAAADVTPFPAQVTSLLLAGADVNARDTVGDRQWGIERRKAALHYACANGHIALVVQLLEAGADPNRLSHLAYYPLHAAINCPDRSRRAELVACLLAAGADPSPIDTNKSANSSPFMEAMNQNAELQAMQLADAGCRISAGELEVASWFHSTETNAIWQRWNALDKRMAQPDFEVHSLSAADLCALANQSREDEVMQPQQWRGHESELMAVLTHLPLWLANDILVRHPVLTLLLAEHPEPVVQAEGAAAQPLKLAGTSREAGQ